MAEAPDTTQSNASANAEESSLDTLIERALDKAVNKALVKINEAIDKSVERAVEKALASYSKRSREPLAIDQQDASQDVPGDQANNELEETQRKGSMGVEEVANSLAEATSHDEDGRSEHEKVLSDNPFARYSDSIRNNPWPDFTCCWISVRRNCMLDVAWNEDLQPLLLWSDDNKNRGGLSGFRDWNCIEANGWLHFLNVATQMYLGIDASQSDAGSFELCLFDTLGTETRFWLEPYDSGSPTAVLRVPVGDQLHSMKPSLSFKRRRDGGILVRDVRWVCTESNSEAIYVNRGERVQGKSPSLSQDEKETKSENKRRKLR